MKQGKFCFFLSPSLSNNAKVTRKSFKKKQQRWKYKWQKAQSSECCAQKKVWVFVRKAALFVDFKFGIEIEWQRGYFVCIWAHLALLSVIFFSTLFLIHFLILFSFGRKRKSLWAINKKKLNFFSFPCSFWYWAYKELKLMIWKSFLYR